MSFDARPTSTDGKSPTDAKQIFTLSATNFTAATSEAMVTLTPATDGVIGSTGTSFVIPSGKRLVLMSLTATTKNASTAAQGVQVRLRYNPTGATTTSSSIIATAGAGTTIATTGAVGGESTPISAAWPTVIEIVGDGTKSIGISQIGTATAGNDVVFTGYLY